MSAKINLLSLSLEGHEIPIDNGLSELLSDPSCWSAEPYVEPAFMKNYTSRVERNDRGSLVTIYEKKVALKKIAQ